MASKTINPSPRPLPLDFLQDVMLSVSVELGRAEATIKRMLELGKGSVVELQKLKDEPIDIRVNGRLVARGEIVVLNDHYGVRVTEVLLPEGVDLLSEKAEL